MKDAVEGTLRYVKRKMKYGIECDGELVGVIRSGIMPMEVFTEGMWLPCAIDKNIIGKWYIVGAPYYGDLNGIKVRISSVFLDKIKH